MSQPIYRTVPQILTAEMIQALREHPTTSVEDKEDWYTRLGWLICAWDVLLDAAPPTPVSPDPHPRSGGCCNGEQTEDVK
jgi:hypothetical protein